MIATAANIAALEPVEQIRAQLNQQFPNIQTLAGTAEAIPLPANSLDAVLCAQSFHWFANACAMQKIHRVLKPGCYFGFVWNVRDETVPWVAVLTRIIAPQ